MKASDPAGTIPAAGTVYSVKSEAPDAPTSPGFDPSTPAADGSERAACCATRAALGYCGCAGRTASERVALFVARRKSLVASKAWDEAAEAHVAGCEVCAVACDPEDACATFHVLCDTADRLRAVARE